jgi:hypothetical protein
MSESSLQVFFSQLNEWLSFIDSLWGVGGAVVVTALFMYRRMRRERASTSAQIRVLSDQMTEITRLVENLEAENARLSDQFSAFSARDFQQVSAALKQARTLPDEQVAVANLNTCFSRNAPFLSEAALSLSRVYLDAFYTDSDLAHLKEADRFVLIAMLVTPQSSDARRLKAEVAIAIASNASVSDSQRTKDELWDAALDFLGGSRTSAGNEQTYLALQQVGTRLRSEGNYELAGAALRAAYRIAERVFGLHSLETLTALNNVATNFSDRKLPADAKPLFEQLAERHQKLAGHIDEATFRFRLAVAACDRQLVGEATALPVFENLVKDGRDRFGRDNRWVLKAQNSFGVCLNAVGREGEAEELYRDTIERETKLFGESHTNPLSTRENLAALLLKVGRKNEAIAEMVDIAHRRSEMDGDAHPRTLEALRKLEEMQTTTSK